MKYVFSFILLFITFESWSQVTILNVEIDTFSYRFYLENIPNDSIIKLKDEIGNELSGKILNDSIYIQIEVFDKNKNIQISGSFVKGLGLLRKQLITIDPITAKFEYILFESYEPLPHGKWVLILPGRELKIYYYNKGILE